MSNKRERLKEAKELLEDGLLSEEQFKQLQQQILSEMGVSSDSSASIKSSSSSSVSSLVSKERLGSYELKSLIGEGGQGSVYLARHSLPAKANEQGGDVALKILHVSDNSSLVRFQREATTGLKLVHSGIVRVFDLVTEVDKVGVVMEYVRGKTLASIILERKGGFSWAEISSWIQKICEALYYAHKQGVVHRDIKPDNIMILGDNSIKILDFGIAKFEEEGAPRTNTGVGMGTINYMAPEQYVDVKNVDLRADIYALGMVIYELLSGQFPWDKATTDYKILTIKETGKLIPLESVASHISPKLFAGIAQSLSSERKDRQSDILAFMKSLKTGKTIVKPVTSVQREERPDTVDFSRKPLSSDVNSSGTVPKMNTVKFDASSNLGFEEDTEDEVEELIVEVDRAYQQVQDGSSSASLSMSSVDASSKKKGGSRRTNIGLGCLGVVGIWILGVVGFPIWEQVQKDAERERVKAELQAKEAELQRKVPVKLIPSGSFTMGCTSGDLDCYDDEKPAHNVEISRAFYLMESEVTQELYESVMGSNPSHFKGSSLPVEKVSWYDAVKFAKKLSAEHGLDECYTISGDNVSWSNKDCKGWRLPTEAEWEYAARGSESYKYAGSSSVDSVAWYNDNSGSKTHNVCGKPKNGYGLCDMSGNVYEWVWDWYDKDKSLYGSHADRGTVRDPYGANSGSFRVFRGGSWGYVAWFARVSRRISNSPDVEGGNLGFRLGRTP